MHQVAYVLLATVFLAACADSTEPSLGPPAALQIVSGDLQSDTVGHELPKLLVVRAVDAEGRPVQGQIINFRVVAGGGSVFAGVALTDSAGEARERWTLGTVARDTQKVEARAVDTQTGAPLVFATFTAVGVPDRPTTLQLVSGDDQEGDVGSAIGDSLFVMLVDEFGNGISNQGVTWTGDLGSLVSPDTAITDLEGNAAAEWTIGLRVDTNYTATARFQDLDPVEFIAVPRIASGTVLVKEQGDNQQQTGGQALPDSLVVSVKLADGRSVIGATVNWAVAQGTGSVSATQVMTDSSGLAAVEWTVGSTSGVQSVSATISEATDLSVAFTANAEAGVRASVVILGDTIVRFTALGDTATLSATVFDAFGNEVTPRPAVEWTSSDPAVVTIDSDGRLYTEGEGVATVLVRLDSLVDSVVVEVTQVGVAVGLDVDSIAFSALSDSVLVTAVVVDQNGNPKLPATFLWSTFDVSVALINGVDIVQSSSGVWVRSASNGETTVRATWIGQNLWDDVFVRVSQSVASVQANPDSTLMTTAGDTLTATVEVLDSNGFTIPSAVVQWTTSDPGVALVDDSGLITSGARGSAIIVATADILADSVAVNVVEFTTVAQGGHHACGITVASGLFCWGSDVLNDLTINPVSSAFGQLGTGDTTASFLPQRVVGNHDFVAVSAGETHTCALDTSGVAFCWGANFAGQVGDGSTIGGDGNPRLTGRWIPTPVATNEVFEKLEIGEQHTCGITAGGAVYCWGRNLYGQLGDGTTTDRSVPVLVSGGLSLSDLAAGNHTCGLVGAGSAYCWGNNNEGQLGFADIALTPMPVSGGINFLSITAGTEHSCGIATTGITYCWGRDGAGELGDGLDDTGGPIPRPIDGNHAFGQVKAGRGHACGLTVDGSAYCWGGTGSGQLGNGTEDVQTGIPVAVVGGLQFKTISPHGAGTCAITNDGVPYCWGFSPGTGVPGSSRFLVPRRLRTRQ